jgi:hypothetical protein
MRLAKTILLHVRPSFGINDHIPFMCIVNHCRRGHSASKCGWNGQSTERYSPSGNILIIGSDRSILIIANLDCLTPHVVTKDHMPCAYFSDRCIYGDKSVLSCDLNRFLHCNFQRGGSQRGLGVSWEFPIRLAAHQQSDENGVARFHRRQRSDVYLVPRVRKGV